MTSAHIPAGPEQERASRAPIVILVGAVILIAALGLGVWLAVGRIEAAAREREARLVANGLALQAEDMRRMLVADALWDDAVLNLDTKLDPVWARDLIGKDYGQTDGFALVYVLGANGAPVFGYEHGRTVPAARFGALGAAVAPLVAQIRSREAARGPILRGDRRVLAPIDASTPANRAGETFVLAASLVQPDHARDAIPSARAPIIVVGEAVDGAFTDMIRRRYLLSDVRLVRPGAAAPAGWSVAPLKTSAGAAAARLAWAPRSPISLLLWIVGPPLAAAFLALVIAPALLIRHERRRNAVLSAATREARMASEAKSAFLATMSHEIRTPLNGILGMAQAIGRDGTGVDAAGRLEVIRQSGEALLSVLNDVLDLSKIEAGKLELDVAEFDLAQVLGGVRDTFEVLALAKGLRLAVDAEGAAGVYLGDAARLRQVLFNLVSNAVKFTPEGAVTVGGAWTGARLELFVEDTGIGVAKSERAAIFGKFVQAGGDANRRYGGSGLGLAICRELVDLMGGAIDVESRPGGGSRFTLSLPLKRIGEAAAFAPAAPAAAADMGVAGAGLRILAAEDNTVNQLVLRALLGSAGLTVTMVGDGAQAVAAWAPDAWDLILMDVQMPHLDGVEATRMIRAKEAASGARHTPIIALSANAMAHQSAAYLAAGMDGHLAKPIEIARLLQVIADIGRARSAPAAA